MLIRSLRYYYDPGLFTMGGSEYSLVQVTYCTI